MKRLTCSPLLSLRRSAWKQKKSESSVGSLLSYCNSRRRKKQETVIFPSDSREGRANHFGSRVSPQYQKTIIENNKQKIHADFKSQGLSVDKQYPGYGSTNDDNIARCFFSNPALLDHSKSAGKRLQIELEQFEMLLSGERQIYNTLYGGYMPSSSQMQCTYFPCQSANYLNARRVSGKTLLPNLSYHRKEEKKLQKKQ